MEVHPHTHTERKKFKHYLWEFLMLFLAVFCGFLAENQREHIEEHRREIKYMTTLLEDLKIDTTSLTRLKKVLAFVISRQDSVAIFLRPPVTPEMVPLYYKESYHLLEAAGFTYNDRTVDELRSSGNYRLIRKQNVTDSLIAYDIRMRGTFTTNCNTLYAGRLKLIGLQDNILDGGLYYNYIDLPASIDSLNNIYVKVDSLKKHGLWPMHLLTTDKQILFNYYNACLDQIGNNQDLDNWVTSMKMKAKNLILLVQKEYHLE